MKTKPFIHLFKCSTGNYLYDVNTDSIIKVAEDTYKKLSTEKNVNINDEISRLQKAGFLKNKHVEISEHPATQLLSTFYKSGLHSLILQVTQGCNLRCGYCIFSGKYNTRVHSNKRMSFDTCRRGIDYLIKHSGNCQDLSIGFYGGEPLLEFSLIKKCVEYSEKVKAGKGFTYRMTTNATLLDKEKIQFLVDHKFKLTISFDGPKEIHDKNRRYANKDKGSYDVVLRKVRFIKDNYNDYFKQFVNFNTVLDPEEGGFSRIVNYINDENLFEYGNILATLISDNGKRDKIKNSNKFIEEYNYEYFKLLLSKLEVIHEKRASHIMQRYFEYLKEVRGGKHQLLTSELPNKWHHSGPCIPGEKSIFLNADEKFYPCERVNEKSDLTVLGDLEKGIDIAKAEKMLNIEKYTQTECQKCWAYSYCDFCVRYAGPDKNNLRDSLLSRCEDMRRTVETAFKDYCVMCELGYDFEMNQIKQSEEI